MIPWKIKDNADTDLLNTVTAYACQIPPKADPRRSTCLVPVEFLRNHGVLEQDLQWDAIDIEATTLFELDELILGALDEDSYKQATDGRENPKGCRHGREPLASTKAHLRKT